MRTLIVWGAGRIGRGFVADIFSEAPGFRTVFVDIDAHLVSLLNARGRYTVFKASRDGIRESVIDNGFEAVHTSDAPRLEALFEEPELLLDIAVHAPRLPEVADMLAPLLAHRSKAGLPMDVMMNVNMARPDLRFKELMQARLSGPALEFFNSQVGVTGIFAMCISPVAPDEYLAQDPLALWNNGWETQTVSSDALKCASPRAPRLLFTRDIEREETRKLYTLNMAHALLSYLGLPLGCETVLEAVHKPRLRAELEAALNEASLGLIHRFGFEEAEMAAWRKTIIGLLENPYIQDGLQRLGADSRRKLGPSDRLTGPARLCCESGGTPAALAHAIRAGFEYENQDEGTQTVRFFYKAHGLAAALKEFCGLKEEDALFKLIVS